MRYIFFLPSLLLLSLGMARAQSMTPQTYQEKYADEVMLQKIELPLAQPSTEDYLLEIARATKLNFFVNARFPAAPPLQGTWKTNWSRSDGKKWRGALISFLLELSNERKLTWQRLDQKTFLWWSEPDLSLLGRVLARQTPRRHLTSAWAARRKGETEEMRSAVAQYLADKNLWDGKSAKVLPDIALQELPESLRATILAAARQEIEHSELIDDGIWFDDAFWKKVKLQVPNTLSPQPAQQVVAIGIVDQDENSVAYTARQVAHPVGSSDGFLLHGTAALDTETEAETGDVSVSEEAGKSATGAPPAFLSSEEISADPALQKKVSFESKSQSFSEVLHAIGKSSGVTLELVPGSVVSGLSITARAQEMTVAEAMNALNALVNVGWLKEGTTYRARYNGSALNDELLRAGDLEWFHYWQEPERRQTAPPQLTLEPLTPVWLQQIVDTVGVPRLQARTKELNLKDGVPFSRLPPELAKALRNHIETFAAMDMLRKRPHDTLLLQELGDNCKIQVGVSGSRKGAGDDKNAGTGDAAPFLSSLNVVSPSGQILASLSLGKRPPPSEKN